MKAHVWTAFTEHWNSDLSYCEPATKQRAHRLASQVLKYLATDILRLDKGTWDVRSNKGGIAVSGEVTLHTACPIGCDRGYYLQISEGCIGPGTAILFRTCQGRKDYTGGHNNFFPIDKLGNESEAREFAKWMQSLVER